MTKRFHSIVNAIVMLIFCIAIYALMITAIFMEREFCETRLGMFGLIVVGTLNSAVFVLEVLILADSKLLK